MLAAVAVVGAATAAGVTNHISSDSLVGIYSASLGYIFGVVNPGIGKGTK